ncbi:NAD-dependent epimerase/dehydratase [Kribbella flavida DSM 17836]|uniref:NAD-dependent epimerase/dehydratase n=1 Tax=Kribbella flavida (strain DSM 17836 / JCM 10339 / NBRC 14399) TaxID=479435 RepID=D2PN44_KRIFD|nr:NAD-dependent epimerase [Kribbella flavida]ADB34528.1 NAD-dependent epimerase/dehydratase [Kribbella flavida DSM 17836]
MNLLILGGTKNLGRHVVEAALRDGHEVTLFNRGRTAPHLFPEVRRITGERAAPDALAGAEWDGVIDLSGLLVHDVRRSAEVLRDRVGHYTFMSSIAVYADKVLPGQTEDAALLSWPPDAPENVFTMDLYGPSKVRAEQLLTTRYGDRTAAVRSGFVVGPYNPDFGNWGEALATGGTLECAARPDQPIQWIDARDLADFLLLVTINRLPGPFTAVSSTWRMADLLDAWHSVVPADLPIDWTPEVDRFHLPHDGSNDGTFQLANNRAVAAGLRLRPPTASARDYLHWIRQGNTPPPPPH